jgi:hypothetical protein
LYRGELPFPYIKRGKKVLVDHRDLGDEHGAISREWTSYHRGSRFRTAQPEAGRRERPEQRTGNDHHGRVDR